MSLAAGDIDILVGDRNMNMSVDTVVEGGVADSDCDSDAND